MRLLFAAVLLCSASLAQAHKPSDAYLWLEVQAQAQGQVQGQGQTQTIEGRWDVALRDLDVVLTLDTNHDDQITWGEVRTRNAAINTYLLAHLHLMSGTTACPLQAKEQAIDQHSDGTYLVVRFTASCLSAATATELTVDYRLFDDIDPTHRGVARITFAGHAPLPVVLNPAEGAVRVTPDGMQPTPAAANGQIAHVQGAKGTPLSLAHAGFLREGIHHILTGYDHVLFLFCLLLPAVLKRSGTVRAGSWEPVSLHAAVWPLLRVITAFTIAHSITLGLASARLVHLSPRFIEPAIALTIMLAALNNLWPVVTRHLAIITFFFGLIHGFGFAEVLRDLDLSAGDFAWALLQFNLGVEIGQLLVVAVALTPLYLLRQQRLYPTAVMGAGSVVGMCFAAIWFAERVFDFKVLPI